MHEIRQALLYIGDIKNQNTHNYRVVQVKNRFKHGLCKKQCFYRDVLLKIRYYTGDNPKLARRNEKEFLKHSLVAEVQLHHDKFLTAKDTGHGAYEIQRELGDDFSKLCFDGLPGQRPVDKPVGDTTGRGRVYTGTSFGALAERQVGEEKFSIDLEEKFRITREKMFK